MKFAEEIKDALKRARLKLLNAIVENSSSSEQLFLHEERELYRDFLNRIETFEQNQDKFSKEKISGKTSDMD